MKSMWKLGLSTPKVSENRESFIKRDTIKNVKTVRKIEEAKFK